jgi:hypothetical protein
VPSPSQFHPEFGYMCPTSRFRRTLRVSLVAAVIGAAGGGIGVLAMADRADRMRSEIRSEIASTIGLGESALAAPVAGAPAASAPCAAQGRPSRDGKCPPPGAARSAALPSPAAAANAAIDAASVEAPSDLAEAKPATSHARKNRKPVQRRDRQDAATRNAFANPYRDRHYDAGPYGDRGYGLAPYGLHYEQRYEGRGLFR